MNRTEFIQMVETIDIPHIYYSFPVNEAPKLPYFVWYFAGTDNFGADDMTYSEILNPVIELYTSGKNFETENTIETVLNAAGLFWNKTEQYLTTEEMFMITYEIGDILNG